MKIFQVKTPLNPEIKYRRMLNKLNLEVREKIADEEMFYPFATKEKAQIMQSIEDWKKVQQEIIYEKCFNPKEGLFTKIKNFFASKL